MTNLGPRVWVVGFVWCLVACAEAAREGSVNQGLPATTDMSSEAATAADQNSTLSGENDPAPSTDAPVAEVDAGTPGPEQDAPSSQPAGDPSDEIVTCEDAALRVATCYLQAPSSGCVPQAIDIAPLIAQFLIDGDSCPTLEQQGIRPATPCTQEPLPMHVTQLQGFDAANELCTSGPATPAATCELACSNLAPCVASQQLDPALADAGVCFRGCLRNADDASTFQCSANTGGDCAAAAVCWTE